MARLAEHASGDQIRIYAFALIPNHFHLLIRTLDLPLSTFMSRLLTGHSGYFNRRHDRSGHLFQNRYKSLVVDEDAYFLELIRYINLNPIRARLITDLSALATWPFSAYSALMGIKRYDWLCVNEALAYLHSDQVTARRLLHQLMVDGLTMGRRPELVGGRSQEIANGAQIPQGFSFVDRRILGDEDFIDRLSARLKSAPALALPRISLNELIQGASDYFSLTPSELCSGSKRPPVVKARAAVIWFSIRQLGESANKLASRLNVKPTAVSMSLSARKGEQDAGDLAEHLENLKNLKNVP